MSLAVGARCAAAVLRRPVLWPTALGQWRRSVPTRWWRRRPFLPVPTSDYLAFRMVTQYGDAHHRPAADDVLNYLTWCRAQRRAGS